MFSQDCESQANVSAKLSRELQATRHEVDALREQNVELAVRAREVPGLMDTVAALRSELAGPFRDLIRSLTHSLTHSLVC
jgi:hypothetical protein